MKAQVLLKLTLSAFVLLFASSVYASSTNPVVITHQVKDTYEDISNNIRDSIAGKGINVAHVLPAGEMLGRTGASFGYQSDIYKEAQTFEFCSAAISHKLARQHPQNIVLCPFTISVYTLNESPELVNLSYRVPVGMPGSEAVVQEVVDLIESIIAESM